MQFHGDAHDGLPPAPIARRVGLVALAVVSIGSNAVVGGAALHRLPYLLAGLTVLFLVQAFWEERTTSGSWLVVSSGTMIVVLLTSITFSVGRSQRDEATALAAAPTTTAAAAAETTTTLVSGLDVPAEVQGAVESRAESERLVACETALAQIAAAIRQTGTGPDTGVEVPPDDEIAGSQRDDAQRLRSCEVRLEAIASTLPG